MYTKRIHLYVIVSIDNIYILVYISIYVCMLICTNVGAHVFARRYIE